MSLERFINKARAVVQARVVKILEDVVFPWYETQGTQHSDRTMRKMIAKRLERDLSAVLWLDKAELLAMSESIDEEALQSDEAFLEEMDAHNPTFFCVANIFPQSTGAGAFTLMVTFYQKSMPSNQHTIQISEFLANFYPGRQLTFKDHDA